MTTPDSFITMFKYDDWANDFHAKTLHQHPEPPLGAIRAYAHILAARRIWLARISSESKHQTDLPFEPGLDLTECSSLRDETVRLWLEFLDGLTSGELTRLVTFHDDFNNPYTMVVSAMLTHVLLHSAHHRGQIALLLRMSGKTPGDADFYLSPMAAASDL